MKLSQFTLAPPGTFDQSSIQVTEALKDVYTHLRDSVKPDATLSTALADFIFVPLSYLLKQPNLSDPQIELLLKVLTILIRRCWSPAGSIPYVLAKQLFPLITFLTGGSPNADDKSEIDVKSDELKLAGSETLQVFFKSLSKQKGAKIYDFFSNVETLPALGHAVTVLLHFCEQGKSIELQLQAIRTLHTLYFDLIADGEILSYILPGNVSSLAKVIAAPGLKTHYTVLVEAIELLGKLLVLVYNDADLKTKVKELESIEDIMDSSEMDIITIEEADFKKVHRTNKWLKATSSQVKLALQNIKKIGPTARIEVKRALLLFCTQIIQECLYSLSSSIPVVVNILSVLSNDSRIEIDSKKLIASDSYKNQKLFDKVVSNELSTSIDKFSSVLQSPNEEKILSTIGAIDFTIRHSHDQVLASKLINFTVMELSDLLKKSLSKSKVISDSNDISNLMLITNETNDSRPDFKQLLVFSKVFSETVETKLAALFTMIGGQDDPSDLIEEFLANGSDTSNYEKAVILWVSKNLLNGHFGNSRENRIVDEFLDFDEEIEKQEIPEITYAVMEFSKGLLDETSENQINQEVELINSIAVDVIGVVAYHMREDFRYELIDYLYPVVDSMASLSENVRRHALNTCMIIADTLYHGSLYEVVLDNSDYLVDAVSIRLSNAMTTRATAILAVCTKIAGFKIIESFKDVIEIIFSLLDYYHGYEDLCIGFFVLFEIIADETRKKYLHDYGVNRLEFFDSTSTFAPWGLQNIEQLKNLLDKTQRDVLVEPKGKELEEDVEAEINVPDSDDEDEQEPSAPELSEKEEKWTSPVPENIYKLLQQIMYYGERLLTHPSAKLHIQILSTYKKVLPILATSTKHLHPIVASLWPIVSKKANDSDPKIVIPAAKVVSQVLEYSGGFLSSRFVDFWEVLKSNKLLVSAKTSVSNTSKIVLPGLNSKAYEELVDMLVTGLDCLGRFIPDVVSEDIVSNCIGVVQDIERFGINSDIAWSMKLEKYGIDKSLSCPESIVGAHEEVYKFASIV